MANKVLLKKSSTAAKVPLTSDLDYGELALNYTDGKLYYKTAGNTIDTFPSLSATATLTNKTLTSPSVTTSLTTGSTTFALVNTTATTVNFAGAATAINIGASNAVTTVNGNLTVAGAYANTYLTTYGSLFIDGTSTNNIIQTTSTTSSARSQGIGLWSSGPTGSMSQIYSGGGDLTIAVGSTLRDRDTPTGGTIAVTITGTTGAVQLASTLGVTGNTTLTGGLTVNGTLTAGGGVGTNGQVLQSTGTGVQWASVSGGGYSDLVEISQTAITTSRTLYSASATTYRGAKYTIQITNSTAYAMYEFLVMHDGTGIYFPYSSSAYVGDSSGNYQNYFHGDYLDSIAITKIQVGNTYHAFNWAVTAGNLVFSASCSSGTISVKGAVLLIKA